MVVDDDLVLLIAAIMFIGCLLFTLHSFWAKSREIRRYERLIIERQRRRGECDSANRK